MCNLIIEQLPAYIAGELRVEEKREVEEHLAHCVSCVLELQAFRRTWDLLDKWRDVAPSEALRNHVRAQVRELMYAEKAGKAGWWVSFKGFSHIVYGTLMAVFSILLLISRSDSMGRPYTESLTPQFILSFSAIWTGLYTLTFWLASRRGNGADSDYTTSPTSSYGVFGPIDLNRISHAGLIAIAISLVISRLAPIDNLVEFCLTQPGLQGFVDKVSAAGLYFLLGGLYALIPLLLVTMYVGGKVPRNPVAHGVLTGAIFVLLMLPGILLQCGSLTLGMIASWIVGTALGSMAGGVTGYWIAFRTREVI